MLSLASLSSRTGSSVPADISKPIYSILLTVVFRMLWYLVQTRTKLPICPSYTLLPMARFCTVCCIAPLGDIYKYLPEEQKQSSSIDVEWKIELHQLVDAADQGCPFCSFVVYRYFHGVATYFFGGISATQDVTCCVDAPLGEKPERLVKALEEVREKCEGLQKDGFTFLLKAEHSLGRKLPDVDKITISIRNTEVEKSKLAELIGLRQQLVLEVYAPEGMSPDSRS